MKVLFDEGVPKAIRKHLSQHQVDTVVERGWNSITNGKLLALIESNEYQVFITADKNMSYQQVLIGRSFATIVLSTNHWPTISEGVQAVVGAVQHAVAGQVTAVDCGCFLPSRMNPPINE